MNSNDPLPRSGSHRVQVFPLIAGRMNQNSGDSWECEMIFCVTAGDFVFTSNEDSVPVTISMEEGWTFYVGGGVVDLTGTAGKFHLSR